MARSARTSRKQRTRRLKRQPAPRASTPWPTIETFLDVAEGDITIGPIAYNPTLRHTAIASDEHNMLVALVRRRGETLHRLLDRLEQALGPALDDQIFVDEINTPSPPPVKSRLPVTGRLRLSRPRAEEDPPRHCWTT